MHHWYLLVSFFYINLIFVIIIEILRKYYKALAAKEDSEYTEEKSDTSFHATLNRKDGEKLHIHATDANNIGLSAQNKKGEKKIPEYEDFKNLVIFAKQQGQTISFGNIKSEFTAVPMDFLL